MQSKVFATLAIAIVGVLVASSAQATSPSVSLAQQVTLPAAVSADLAGVAAQCSEGGGKPRTDGAVKTVDLNGDGKDDYVLDVGAVNCDGAASIYGDREKGVTVYVGDGQGGAVAAFSDTVFGAKIESATAQPRSFGSRCRALVAERSPRPTSRAKPSAIARSRGARRRTKFEYAPVSTVRMVE